MKSRIILLLTGILATKAPAFSQVASLSDSSTNLKNPDGRIHTGVEARETANLVISLRQEPVEGRKVITILPAANDETAGIVATPQTFRKSLLNKPLAHLRLPGLYYQVWDTKQLKGRVLVISFWYSTCTPCILEMPVLNELVTDLQYKNVVFLAPAPERAQQIRKFLKKNPFSYNIIPAAQKYMDMLRVENFPTHLVVDKNGIIRQVYIGYAGDTKKKLQAVIEQLLKERW